MKHGEVTVLAGKTAIAGARSGAVAGILLVAGLLPLPLDAAIDRDELGPSRARIVIDSQFPQVVAVDNDDTLPPVDDRAWALGSEMPREPRAPIRVAESDAPPSEADKSEAAKDEHARELDQVFPPRELGLMDRVQDWLARANREFQFTIIRRLSTAPAGGGGDDIARKLQDVKEEDAEAAADRAEEAIRAAQAKQAAEAKRQRELADTQERAAERAKAQEAVSAPQVVPKADDSAALAEEMRKERERLEAESRRIEEQRKLAEDKRKADEQKRLEDLRLATQAKVAEQKAAEAKTKAAEEAAAQEAAREAAAAKEKELVAQQAAEAQHQRDLADAAEKAAEEAKRVAAHEEAAKAAAAKEAAAKEAAGKENAARAAAAKDAEAKRMAEQKAAEGLPEQKEAMVESEDKEDKGDGNIANAAPEAPSSSDRPAETGEPAAKPAEKSSSDAVEVARTPRHRHARAVREASNHRAHGPVVKRWIRRARVGSCRYAGQKISLPGRYVAAPGDTLWRIALRHYRSGLYFMRIYRANRDIIRDPNLIHPCQRFYLPKKRG